MKGVFKMEKEFILKVNEKELNYLKTVLYNLLNIEKKIPNKMKTENSNILKVLHSKIDFLINNEKINKNLKL